MNFPCLLVFLFSELNLLEGVDLHDWFPLWNATTLTGCFPVSQLCAVYMKETLTLLPCDPFKWNGRIRFVSFWCFLLLRSIWKACNIETCFIWIKYSFSTHLKYKFLNEPQLYQNHSFILFLSMMLWTRSSSLWAFLQTTKHD